MASPVVPQGFVLNEPQAAQGLPSGFVLNDPQAAQQAPDQPQGAIAQPEAAQPAGAIATGLDALATLGSSIIAEPIAGIAGIASQIVPGGLTGGERVEQVREVLTFQPRTEGVKQALSAAGEVLAPIQEGITRAGEVTAEVTGIPALGAAVATVPTAIAELIGIKGLSSIRSGTRLIDDVGRPTKALRKALDKQGLDFDNLTPEAKNAIPVIADKAKLTGSSLIDPATETALIAQIKSGGRDDVLAGLKVQGNKLLADKSGAEAVRQGFEPGFVQSVKTATPETQAGMDRMLKIMRQTKKSARKGLDTRPSDVIGDAVTDRVTFIRDSANVARKELNEIATNNLPGKSVDGSSVIAQLETSLGDLNIDIVDGPGGVPKPVFKGSQISKDPTSQRVITDVIDLLSEGGQPDALRMHNLKKQLDRMLDFNKKSAQGLTDAGKGVVGDIRKSLNNAIREVDPDYARVNDVLSESLTALENLDKAAGTIDVFGKGANKAIGTRMRALLSNQQGRVKLENALDEINATANNLGGKFSDDIKDLVMFADGLDQQFGTAAKTSLQGQLQQGVGQVVDQGLTRAGISKAGEALGKGAEKLGGINEFNAFEAMQDILNR